MALMKCPECGKENVSDSAETCPECGYSIRRYIEQKKREEKNKEEQIKKEKRFKELSGELEAKLKEIDNLPMPEKPSYFKLLFDTNHGGGLTIALIIIVIVSLLLAFITKATFFAVIVALGVVLGFPILLIITGIDYNMFVDLYYRDTKDWNATKQRKKDQLIEYYKDKDRIDYERDHPHISTYSGNGLKCPVCGGKDINKISTVNRAASVAMVGIASNKIGKQYKCNKCGHLW